MIKPGLKELAAAGKLTVRYESGDQFFPGSDSCSSGLDGPAESGNLLKKNGVGERDSSVPPGGPSPQHSEQE